MDAIVVNRVAYKKPDITVFNLISFEWVWLQFSSFNPDCKTALKQTAQIDI